MKKISKISLLLVGIFTLLTGVFFLTTPAGGGGILEPDNSQEEVLPPEHDHDHEESDAAITGGFYVCNSCGMGGQYTGSPPSRCPDCGSSNITVNPAASSKKCRRCLKSSTTTSSTCPTCGYSYSSSTPTVPITMVINKDGDATNSTAYVPYTCSSSTSATLKFTSWTPPHYTGYGCYSYFLNDSNAWQDKSISASNWVASSSGYSIYTIYAYYAYASYDVTLSANGGTHVSPSVTNISTSYGFALNSSTGYYTSNNKAVTSSYALCKLSFTTPANGNLALEVINYAEANYDFGIFSNIDTTLASSNTADTSNVYKSFKGLSQAAPQYLTYSNISAGSHYIYIKYRKDGSADSNNDNLQFRVLTSTAYAVTYNTLMPTVTIPSRTGYTFAGYYSSTNGNGTKFINADGTPANAYNLEGSTIYAHWEPVVDTITYNSNGGSAVSSDYVRYNEPYGRYNIYDPTKTHPDGGLTRSGNYFTINRNNTGSDMAWNNFNYDFIPGLVQAGTKYTVVLEVTSFSNNAFDLVFTSPYDASSEGLGDTANGRVDFHISGTGVQTAVLTTKSTISLNTDWTYRSYIGLGTGTYAHATFRLSVFVGTPTINTSSFTYASVNNRSSSVSLPTPTRTGYNFAGWYKESSFTNQVTTTSTVSTVGNHTLYAKWTGKTYSVYFDTNKGSGSTTPTAGSTSVTATYGSAMPSATMPTRVGYTFQGFYDTSASSGGTQYYTASGSSTRAWNKTSNTTLYARWKANEYTVFLDYGVGNITATFDQKMPSITPPTREGWVFKGYSYAGTLFYDENGIGIKEFTIGANTAFNARWQEKTWTDGYYASSYGGGNGTQSNPYIISTAAHLARLAYATNNNLQTTSGLYDKNAYYKQTADIDLNAHEWGGIGTESVPFAGNYNGNIYQIRNTRIGINTPLQNYVGLFFSTSGATIQNVVMKGGTIQSKEDTGTLIGRMRNNTTIKNVQIIDLTITANGGAGTAGGLVGAVFNKGTIQNSEIKNINITVTGRSNTSGNIGGVTGYIEGGSTLSITDTSLNNVTLTNSKATSNISMMLGANYGSTTITSSYGSGTINGTSSKVMYGNSTAWGNWSLIPNVNGGLPIQKGLYHSGGFSTSQDVYNYLTKQGYTVQS